MMMWPGATGMQNDDARAKLQCGAEAHLRSLGAGLHHPAAPPGNIDTEQRFTFSGPPCAHRRVKTMDWCSVVVNILSTIFFADLTDPTDLTDPIRPI